MGLVADARDCAPERLDFKLAFCGADRKIARSTMEQNIADSPFLFTAWAWFDKNKKQVLFGAVAVAVAGFVIGLIVWSKKQNEVKAGEALSQALLAQITSAGKAEAAEGLLKVASAYSGTPAGAQAMLLGAGALFASGKYAEAQPHFERFNRDYAGHPLVAQAKLGLAACLSAQGKMEEAALAYKDLADRYPSANTVPQARFALAGIYESQGKLDDALNLFEQVARADANTSLGSEAGMRAEEIRLKLPPIPMPDVSSLPTITSTNAPLLESK
jgi:tetratricopeptide (TPR) repeat protein